MLYHWGATLQEVFSMCVVDSDHQESDSDIVPMTTVPIVQALQRNACVDMTSG